VKHNSNDGANVEQGKPVNISFVVEKSSARTCIFLNKLALMRYSWSCEFVIYS